MGALLGSGQEVIHNFEVHILDDWGDNSYQGTGHGTYAGIDESESTDYSNQSVTGSTGGYSSSEDNEIEQQGGFTFEQDQDNATELPLRLYAKLTLVENVPQGTVVAQFKGEDVDEDELLGYSLVTGLGDDDNHLFTIDENGTLRTAGQIDYEESTELTILVRTTDPHGAYLEENFVIEVIDLDEDVPVLTLLGEANMTHGVGLPFVDSGASWTCLLYTSPSPRD